MEKIYYVDQTNWTDEDYYYLNRYLNRMLLYCDKRIEEIKELDLNKMSIETKTILRCLLEFQKKEYFMDKYPNLTKLKEIGALEKPLLLENPPQFYYDIYTKYNIYW